MNRLRRLEDLRKLEGERKTMIQIHIVGPPVGGIETESKRRAERRGLLVAIVDAGTKRIRAVGCVGPCAGGGVR